jgi:hypothetical protein
VGDIVDLHGRSKPFEDDPGFVQDMARFADGVLSEAQIRKKYRLAANVWEALGNNDELVERIEAEKLRRIRDGSTKREKSQQLITKAPPILDNIASDVNASPRHRVDAIKALDSMAANGPEAVPAADRFIITIRLDSDTTLHFDKPRAPMIENNPNDSDTAPQLPFSTDNKRENDDDESF